MTFDNLLMVTLQASEAKMLKDMQVSPYVSHALHCDVWSQVVAAVVSAANELNQARCSSCLTGFQDLCVVAAFTAVGF